MEPVTITDRSTGRKMPLAFVDEDGREVKGYMHTKSPEGIEVVDAEKFDSKLESFDNGSRIAVRALLDDTSLTRQYALKLDYKSKKIVDNLLFAGRVISVGEPSFDQKLPALARNNLQSFERRAGVLDDLVRKAEEVEAEYRALLNGRRNVLSEYCDTLENYRRAVHHASFGMAERVVEYYGSEFLDQDRKTLSRIVNIVLDTNGEATELTQELADNIRYVMIAGEISARDRYLGLLQSHKSFGTLENVLDATADVRFGMESLGATLDEAIDYAEAGEDFESKFAEHSNFNEGTEARNKYDEGVVLGRKIGMPMADSIIIGNILARSEMNMHDIGYIIAREKGLGREENTREFGRIYGIAVQRYGLERATLSFVPLYFETLKSAFESRTQISLGPIAVHVDPGVELLKDQEYRKNIKGLASNAFYAARRGIAENPYESWQFAKASIEAAKKGGDVNRWAEAVELIRKNYDISLSGSIRIADALEIDFKKSGVYGVSDVIYTLDNIEAKAEKAKVGHAINMIGYKGWKPPKKQ